MRWEKVRRGEGGTEALSVWGTWKSWGGMCPSLGLPLPAVPSAAFPAAVPPPPLPKCVHLPVNRASCFQLAFPCCREMQRLINPVYHDSQTAVKEAGKVFLSILGLQQNLFVLVQPPWHCWSSSCSVLAQETSEYLKLKDII